MMPIQTDVCVCVHVLNIGHSHEGGRPRAREWRTSIGSLSSAVHHICPLGAAHRRELWETSVLQLRIKLLLWQCTLARWLSRCGFLTIWGAALCVTRRLFSCLKNKSVTVWGVCACCCCCFLLEEYIQCSFVLWCSLLSSWECCLLILTGKQQSGLEHHFLKLENRFVVSCSVLTPGSLRALCPAPCSSCCHSTSGKEYLCWRTALMNSWCVCITEL